MTNEKSARSCKEPGCVSKATKHLVVTGGAQDAGGGNLPITFCHFNFCDDHISGAQSQLGGRPVDIELPCEDCPNDVTVTELLEPTAA